jgi:outer membrane protein
MRSQNHSRWLLIAIALISVYAATLNTVTWLTPNRVGYVDSSRLLEKYKGAIAAREKLNKQTETWTQNLKTLEQELNQLNQELVQSKPRTPRKVLQSKQDQIARKREEYARYGQAVSGKSAQLEEELLKPVLAELNAAMADYGEGKGYDIIFGTTAGGNILYGRKAVDLTEDFLSYANAR